MALISPTGSFEGSRHAKMEDVVNELPDFSSERSPRFGNLGFLKGLTERKAIRGMSLHNSYVFTRHS